MNLLSAAAQPKCRRVSCQATHAQQLECSIASRRNTNQIQAQTREIAYPPRTDWNNDMNRFWTDPYRLTS